MAKRINLLRKMRRSQKLTAVVGIFSIIFCIFWCVALVLGIDQGIHGFNFGLMALAPMLVLFAINVLLCWRTEYLENAYFSRYSDTSKRKYKKEGR